MKGVENEKESLMTTKDIQIIRLSDRPELKDRMAQWFHDMKAARIQTLYLVTDHTGF